MIHRTPYRQGFSILLLCLFLLPLIEQEWHHWTVHHAPAQHCTTDTNEQHIHDSSYQNTHCPVCTMGYSAFYVAPVFSALLISQPSFPGLIPTYADGLPRHSWLGHPLRGPPVWA